MTRITALLLLFAATGPVLAQSVLHVDADAAGAGDGSSWANAFPSLADALSTATSGDQIWVAAGTYRPDDGVGRSPGDRTASFALKSGVRLHGGFAGTEASLADRSPAGHSTFLSGDLAGDDDGFSLAEDNSYHVVRAIDASDDTLLEGFVVIGGRADGADADSLGGGLLVEGGSPWVINVRFNSSTAGCGGGLAVTGDASPTIVNAVVNGNRATVGGGICALDSAANMVNATVSNNTALRAPGVYNAASTVDLANSIVAGNMPFDVAGHCEVWQYPCSFFHETEEVQTLTQQVLAEANEVAVTGGMPAALEFLQNHPDVVQASGNSVAVAARVAGGSMAMLVDDQDFASSIPPPSLPGGIGKAAQDRPVIPDSEMDRFNRPRALRRGIQPGSRTIVGGDTNGDGVVNNRDQKKSLILSPFDTWDGFTVRGILGATYGYRGGFDGTVDYAGTPQDPGDFDLSNWMSWSDYDYVYVGSWSAGAGFPNGRTFSSVNTGILRNDFEAAFDGSPVQESLRGVGLMRAVYPDGLTDQEEIYVALSDDFFRDVYGDELSDVLIHCAFCHIGSTTLVADAQARMIAVGWSPSIQEVIAESNGIDWSVASSAALELATQLSYGRTVLAAFRNLNNVDLLRYLTPTLSRAYGLRITELPQLTYDPGHRGVTSLLTDLMDVTDLVRGTIGDGQNDTLIVTPIIRGLTRGSVPGMDDLSFLVNGREAPQIPIYFPPGASTVPGSDEASVYMPPIGVELGFPLESGDIFELRAVYDIPDLFDVPGQSGVSSYAADVTVDAFSCNSRVQFGGFRNGAFTGAANFRERDDGTASLLLTSIQEVLGGVYSELFREEAEYQVNMSLANRRVEEDPDDPNRTITVYDVRFGGMGSLTLGAQWSSGYYSDDDPCPVCGGTIKIDSTGVDGATYGSFEFTSEDTYSTPMDPKPTTVEGTFKALPGSPTGITPSPYLSCLEEYWDKAEEIFE